MPRGIFIVPFFREEVECSPFLSFIMPTRLFLCTAICLLLVSCGGDAPAIATEDALLSSSSSSPSLIVETHNVSFIGTVRAAGISIYMEGTHRLELADGRFILLASESVDLNGYVGEQAEVTGSIRPTIEEGGTIMRVERIRLIETPSSGSSSSAASFSFSSAISSSAPAAASSATQSIAASSRPPAVQPSSSSVASSAPSSANSVPAANNTAQVASMAKQDLTTAKWTQAYCAPPVIGFCVPVHRNWYFKSFGTATEALWHLEVGAATIENPSDGAIAVDLLGGSLSTKGFTDKDVRDDGTTVRGYREWTKDRHLVLSAPSALRGAVEYMTQHLSAMEEQPGT